MREKPSDELVEFFNLGAGQKTDVADEVEAGEPVRSGRR